MYTNLNEETALVVVEQPCCTVWEQAIFMTYIINSQPFNSYI